MQDVIKTLRDDSKYYGEYGQQFLSNSDIGVLLSNPKQFRKPRPESKALLEGRYFHTAILEPDKLKSFKIVEASTRNTKAYKEISNGELCLLKHEVDQIELMTDKVLANDMCRDLIRGINVEYERPGITELEGEMWKGKADIVNHDEKLIIDLKTTADLSKFKWSASKYNYDSQAYIYSKLFGYEFLFIAIDKNTHQIGIFDCSPQFYERGADKVARAAEQYRLFFKSEDFDPQQFFINQTL